MRLELDVGNTRIKWRAMDHRGVFASGLDLKNEIESQARCMELVEAVWVSSVHEEQNAWIAERFPQAVFAQSQVSQNGLINSYADVHKMGVDRWLAMLSAWHKRPNKAHIVIDAGTALTLDLIDEFGRHVGGYICPGFAMMKKTLLGSTDQVVAHEDWSVGRAPGNDTQLCVDHGIQDMVVSWLEYHRKMQPQAEIWLTGGDAARLLSLMDSPVQHETDLVLDGLSVCFQKS